MSDSVKDELETASDPCLFIEIVIVMTSQLSFSLKKRDHNIMICTRLQGILAMPISHNPFSAFLYEEEDRSKGEQESPLL